MVFWNAPIPQKDHAEKAVKCGIEMLQRLEELKKKWAEKRKRPLI